MDNWIYQPRNKESEITNRSRSAQTVIPRYDPTFKLRDLIAALRSPAKEDANDILCAQLRQLYGVKHAFLFNSARMALFALFKAYGRPGAVLMPAYTCIVVPEAVQCAGYRPVFAD